jgi:hypothetical protein
MINSSASASKKMVFLSHVYAPHMQLHPKKIPTGFTCEMITATAAVPCQESHDA